MQYLRVLAVPAADGQFDVYWTNTELESVRGIAHVVVSSSIGKDRNIVAELHTLQYLLEEVESIGKNVAGSSSIKLIVSAGAIKKLARQASDKEALVKHAKFLTHRFYGCKIEVKKDMEWMRGISGSIIRLTLDATTPLDETIIVHGLGEVTVTSHVVKRFAERISKARSAMFTMGEAWRALRKMAGDEQVIEVDKSTSKKRLKYAIEGRQEGRYFMHPSKGWIFVCTKMEHQKIMALVTVYQEPAP